MSSSGSVNRGLCTVSETGFLESIVEVHNIYRDEESSWHSHNSSPDLSLHGNSIVSMTFWGFQSSILKLIEVQWFEFLQQEKKHIDAEFYIPSVVNSLVASGKLALHVLHTPETWMGLTYKQDVDGVKVKLKALHDSGFYSPDR